MRRSSLLFGLLLLFGAALPLAGAHAQAESAGADTDKRLQRLEEQIVDLNAQLGTVGTMSPGGGAQVGVGSSSGGFGGGDDGGRISEIETQMRALSSQMSEILRRLDQIERRSGSLRPGRGSDLADLDEDVEQGTGFSVGGDAEPQPQQPQQRGRTDSSGLGGGFGTTIETGPAQGGGGTSGAGYFGGSGSGSDSGAALGGSAPVRTAARSSPQAQASYDAAYNALVQRNYRAALTGFEDFVQANASDPLAGSAYFWLGEAAFISGEYRKAADSFLKSSTDYPQNEKAAESLLKLGISLKRLGENQAACSSFTELARRFPSATPVLQRAERERSRTKC